MYHSVCERPSRAGDYLVLPETFYGDMKYLHEKGYETVTAGETLKFARFGGDFPEKPVIITFDDGFLNNLTYVLPVLEEFDMEAVVNIVGSYSVKAEEYDDHNPNYAYLTSNEIMSLFESGRFEIGSHTYDMHGFSDRRGADKKPLESDEEYFNALTEDISLERKFLREDCGIFTNIFAYPYGFIADKSGEILYDNGFEILFTCCERHNSITAGKLREGEPLFLDRYNRAYGLSSEEFMKKCEIN